MSSGGCVWKASGSGFRADESIGSKQGISGRHRPTFLTAGGLWACGVASSTFSRPRVRNTKDSQLGQIASANEGLHPARNGLTFVLVDDAPGIPTVGRYAGGS